MVLEDNDRFSIIVILVPSSACWSLVDLPILISTLVLGGAIRLTSSGSRGGIGETATVNVVACKVTNDHDCSQA